MKFIVVGLFIERFLTYFNWQFASTLAQSQYSKSALLMLPVGYLVLWSKEFSDLFKYRADISKFQIFDVDTRLMLIYFGALSVAAGVSVYNFRCPKICKNHRTGSEYFNAIIGTANVSLVKDAVVKAIGEVSEDKRFGLKSNTLEAAQPFVSDTLTEQKIQRAFKSDDTMKSYLSTVLHNQFKVVVHSRVVGCCLSVALILSGWLALAIPSIEVFLLVFHKILTPTV